VQKSTHNFLKDTNKQTTKKKGENKMSNRGQVFKRGSKYSFYFSYTHNGKRKQVGKGGFKTQLLAQQALTKALSEIDGGRLVGADQSNCRKLFAWLGQRL
jgi:hypothetical protein